MIVRLLPLLALVACAMPSDAFIRGERSLLAHDLPSALVAFDAVPVSHARYPEARATALTVERRMRRGHELLLQALLLRGEWRDAEALTVLRRAQAIWPRMPGVGSLITATENRARLLGPQQNAAEEPAAVVVPALPGELAITAVPPSAALLPESEPLSPSDEPEQAPADPAEVTAAVALPPCSPAPARLRGAPVPVHEDPVALGLVAVEITLGRGELEAAVIDLLELSDRFPVDARVGRRLSLVLHQRALLRYGRGQLAAAILDWERVLALDPKHGLAKSLLVAARAESGAATPGR